MRAARRAGGARWRAEPVALGRSSLFVLMALVYAVIRRECKPGGRVSGVTWATAWARSGADGAEGRGGGWGGLPTLEQGTRRSEQERGCCLPTSRGGAPSFRGSRQEPEQEQEQEPEAPPRADAYLYCAHGRVRARPMARRPPRRQGAIYPSAGWAGCGLDSLAGPLERGRAGALRSRGLGQGARAGGSGRGLGQGAARSRSRSTTRSRSRCASGAPSPQPSPSFIRTASAGPSTHRKVRWARWRGQGRWGSDGGPASTPLRARGCLPGCPTAPFEHEAEPAASAGTSATGSTHGIDRRPDRPAAMTDGLSPIGFLDVHGLIEREGVAWPPYNLCT